MFNLFKKKPISSEVILSFINPMEQISTSENIQEICMNNSRLTLIEKAFFNNIHPIVTEICNNKIAGDIVNVGVFKGGASLYMKSLFEENNKYCKWWLFDSFNGFNESSLTKDKDKAALSMFKEILNPHYTSFPSKRSVEQLFVSKFLEKNLFVIEGYIENTLKSQTINDLCFIHIDVDFFQPTYYALNHLYPKLNTGGWVIIDDYNVELFNCKEAVDDFRQNNKIDSPIVTLGEYQIGWRKE